MSIMDRVYRIPSHLDQKVILVEINDLFSYLREEQKFITETLEVVAALERFYRSSAQSFINTRDSTAVIPADLPLTTGFKTFRQTRLNFSDRWLEVATRISAMLNSEFRRLNSNFEATSKQLKTDLKNVQSILQSPLDNLVTSIAGYQKYFKQLQQFYMNPAQAGKAVKSLDEKLSRVNNSYLIFHQKFVDYCAARDPVFTQIDMVVRTTNSTLMDLLGILSEVDSIVVGDLADPPERRFSAAQDEATDLPNDQWPEEEEEIETPFQVKLSQPLNVAGVLMPVNNPFLVVDSSGMLWKLKDKTGRPWSIPQIYLTPDGKVK
jgi:hypothetical protein